jgi:hypothetical protein
MKAPMTNWRSLSFATWSDEAIAGSAGSIESIARATSAMIEAIMATNCPKGGRWPTPAPKLAGAFIL